MSEKALSGWIVRNIERVFADMEFVKNFRPPDFQAKNFTPSIPPNFRVAELDSLSSGAKMAMKIFVKRVFTIFDNA